MAEKNFDILLRPVAEFYDQFERSTRNALKCHSEYGGLIYWPQILALKEHKSERTNASKNMSNRFEIGCYRRMTHKAIADLAQFLEKNGLALGELEQHNFSLSYQFTQTIEPESLRNEIRKIASTNSYPYELCEILLHKAYPDKFPNPVDAWRSIIWKAYPEVASGELPIPDGVSPAYSARQNKISPQAWQIVLQKISPNPLAALVPAPKAPEPAERPNILSAEFAQTVISHPAVQKALETAIKAALESQFPAP